MVTREGSRPARAEQRLKELGIKLPAPPQPFGTYAEAVQTGNLLFLSGMLPTEGKGAKFVGAVGAGLDLEAGRKAGHLATLNAPAVPRQHLGARDKVTRLVGLSVLVGTSGDLGAKPWGREAIKDVIEEIRSLTSKPFAMNLWVSMEDEGARKSDESAFNRSLSPLAIHLATLGAPRPVYKPYLPTRFEDQARVLLDAKVPAFSFIYGIPPKEILEECRTKSIVTIGAATPPDEAAALHESGVDAIAASGFEAGGHRGSFLRAAEDSLTGTVSLAPQIVDIADVPVIAAGGIGDARRVIA